MTAQMIGTPLATAAHAYARRGWAVLPVHHLIGDACSCREGAACQSKAKHPMQSAWGEAATKSGADVAEIWQAHPDANLGLATGSRSGFWVLDVDDLVAWSALLDGRPEPETYTVRTRSGGRHFYFTLPDFEIPTNAGKIAAGLDLRGEGGMVVAPPSVSAKGRYELLRDLPVADASDWLLDGVRETCRKPAPAVVQVENTGTPTVRGDAYARATVTNVLAELDGLHGPWRKGAGWDDGTFNAACTLVEFANAGWNDYTLADARRDLFAHAPRDEAWGADQHAAKFDSAVQTVGGAGRVLPAPTVHEGDPFAGLVPTATRSSGAGAQVGAPAVAGVVDTPGADKPTGKPAVVDDDVHHGQVRMAYRLAEQYVGKLLYVYGIGWLSWDGTRWTDEDPGSPTRAVVAVLKAALGDSIADKELRADIAKCESSTGVAGVLTLAGALPPLTATVADLDADPYALNVANGTLDLLTGVLRSHRPEDRITKVTTGAYNADANSTVWDAFLDRVLPDAEVRGFVQRVVGVALLGTVVEHVLPILTGTGANGKGVFYGAVLDALGDYAGTVEPDLLLHRQGAHPTGEMDLMGKRFVVLSETERDRRMAEATMKRLTGGDKIRARRMRQDFIEFKPSHTVVMITNNLPRVSGDDQAIWRRLRVVPFAVTIPKDQWDRHLGETLKLHADAVLKWAVAGLADYTARGGLDEPTTVLTATSGYQLSSDAVGRFVAEECTLGAVLKATTTQLHERWCSWARDDGAEDMSLRAFGQALDRHGYPTSTSSSSRFRIGIMPKVVLS